MSILEQAEALNDKLIEYRRCLHRHPEPSYHEENTSAFVAEKVRGLGFEVREKQGGWGVIAELPVKGAEGTVLLRADMDSLPIQEDSGLPFSSKVPGQAHLCGHDGHCTMLLGAAEILASSVSSLKRNVRVVFQSAEEVPPGGAIELIESGALDGVTEAYALHVDPKMPTGTFGSRAGPMLAAVNEFRIKVIGKGGHAAYPHLAADPIVVAAEIITRLQTIVSRRLPPTESGVVSVCQIEGGTAFNVIPDEVLLVGTTRFFSQEYVSLARRWIEEIAKGCSEPSGCRALLDFLEGYPALANHPNAVDLVRQRISALWSEDCYFEADQTSGGEDFARFLEHVPGAMVWIGIRNSEIGSTHFLHSPHFRLDEDCLWRGAALLASLALPA